MNEPMRVPLWHRKEKTISPARAFIYLILFALCVALSLSHKITYDLDGTTLMIRNEHFYGLTVNEERLPVSDILECNVETEKKMFGLYRRKSLGIFCKGAKFTLSHLGSDSEAFHDGLTQALQKQPIGTFHGEHRDVQWLTVVLLCIFFVSDWCNGLFINRKRKTE